MHSRRSAAVAAAFAVAVGACSGEHEGPGTITGQRIPDEVVRARTAAQTRTSEALARRAATPAPTKQILFGDLHVHTTFSADAFMMSLPILQGEGAHPVANACDFARYCSALDFWSINDHAEALTPQRWRETKETVRQCNALAGDPADPDLVTFLGWEWTQIGRTAADHYGHKIVVLLDTEDDRVPIRPINSGGFATQAMRQQPPLRVRIGPQLLDWPNRQRYRNLMTFQEELRVVPDCPDDVNVRDLPEDCLEGASTPEVLYRKLHEWGYESLVIPHGTTWGIYTPEGSSWDKQLTRTQHDPELQTLVEVFSGHGNSEEHRDWRAVRFEADGTPVCREPHDGYEPCCWRAGEIIRARCDEPTSAACEARVDATRREFLAAGSAGRLVVPGADLPEWKNCGSCPDCYLPAMNYRPASSVQYMLARTNFDEPNDPLRFHFGFIASSDNHRARPGTGYKEYGRPYNTEAAGAIDEKWHERLLEPVPPAPEPIPAATVMTNRQAYQQLDFERQASFFMTGGLVAVHATGRSRHAIWDAFERREVYGTSGPQILLWFDLLSGPDGTVTMGQATPTVGPPRFRVRAAGAFKQAPGCPEVSTSGLSAERLERLCRGECFNPTDERLPITRVEVVRIRRQIRPDESAGSLIDDPWKVLPCPQGSAECVVEFDDPDFAAAGREVVYYVRALQAPTPAVNAGALRCDYDSNDQCGHVNPCYGDYRTPLDEDCLAMNEERAWSSPLYVQP
jgi:hypothetical protein